MSLLEEWPFALNKRMPLTLFLILAIMMSQFSNIVTRSIHELDYEDYYDEYDDYSGLYEPVTIHHVMKLGETVVLSCPNNSRIWRNGNYSVLVSVNITVQTEKDAGFYNCFNFHRTLMLRHRIVILPGRSLETESISSKNESTSPMNIEEKLKETKTVGVESEYILSSLISSFSGAPNKSIFYYTHANAKSHIAAKSVDKWHFVFPMIISLFYKFC